MSTAEPLDALAAIASVGIPERPSPALDRVIDATERCLARHGVRRTTMSDIAKEMGVSRPTLYKQVASVEEAIALAVSRQLYQLLDEVMGLLAQGAGPQTFIDMAVRAVTVARTYPVTARMLTLEPDLMGAALTGGQLATYVEQIIDLFAPVLAAAMQAGAIRVGDPRLTAELIVRLTASLMLVPTSSGLDEFVRFALQPVLDPAPVAKRSKAAR